MGKIRLDDEIYRQGLTNNRQKAAALVIAGQVFVNGVKIDKPGTSVKKDVKIYVEPSARYVSRGGYKLEKAIKEFGINFLNKTVLDVGASTGGYTDCALQNGARHVFALDVGYGQLDWQLRQDPRVTTIERTNIRNFTLNDLGEQVDIITIDVSFISTKLVFPVVAKLLKDRGAIISLIKPQFEASREKVGNKGIVKNPAVHEEVLLNCISHAATVGLTCADLTFSPITGAKGNIEYFLLLKKSDQKLLDYEKITTQVVIRAHENLGG